jgi:hypothetical protein
MTETNITGLERLSAEFGFQELSEKLSNFLQGSKNSQRREIGSSLARLRIALFSESFMFMVKEALVESDVAEATAFRRGLSTKVFCD